MIPVLETERLYLRNLQEIDVEAIYDYRNAEECYAESIASYVYVIYGMK